METGHGKSSSNAIRAAAKLREFIEKIPGVVYAFVPGDAEDLEKPGGEIEIVVIGGPDLEETEEAASQAEKELGRTLRVYPFALRELQERFKIDDESVADLLQKEKIMLIGDEAEMISLVSGI